MQIFQKNDQKKYLCNNNNSIENIYTIVTILNSKND